MVQPLWKTVWSFPKKFKIELSCDSAVPLLGVYPEYLKSVPPRDICNPLFIAALFIITKIWKQPKCPSTNKWIKTMYYIHSMKYYSALKKKKILPFVTTWMNPDDVMLSEISQSQKDKYCMIPVI